MLDRAHVPPVTADEMVSRYLLFSKWSRADGTIRHDAFMPPTDLELSVTRHLQAAQAEIWQVGLQVAAVSGRKLHGRTDLQAATFIRQNLQVDPDPVPGNPNHVKVTRWPLDKSEQMMVAKLIVATPGLRRIPPPSNQNPSAVSFVTAPIAKTLTVKRSIFARLIEFLKAFVVRK